MRADENSRNGIPMRGYGAGECGACAAWLDDLLRRVLAGTLAKGVGFIGHMGTCSGITSAGAVAEQRAQNVSHCLFDVSAF